MTRVRAVYDAVRVPGTTSPYDTAHLVVHYPAAGSSDDPVLGIVPPDPAFGPLPVVLLAGNFNCPPELYAWLAKRLAAAGRAVVTRRPVRGCWSTTRCRAQRWDGSAPSRSGAGGCGHPSGLLRRGAAEGGSGAFRPSGPIICPDH